jgi:hypothetical protein
MTDARPIETTNLDRYGHGPLDWSRARSLLDATGKAMDTWYLGTTSPDGSPHAAGVGALWHDGELYFTSGAASRKSRNLARTPAASISISLEGLDLVFEGGTLRVTDRGTLDTVAKRYHEDGWPVTVDGEALTAPYSAPSAGPPPWQVHRLRFDTVYGVATAEPNGATRWRFAV